MDIHKISLFIFHILCFPLLISFVPISFAFLRQSPGRRQETTNQARVYNNIGTLRNQSPIRG